MQLLKKERVILINQYSILKYLDPEKADHYDELIQILQDGYEILYFTVVYGIDDGMPFSQGQFVWDILEVYGFIESYKRKNPDDGEVCSHNWCKFKGFDGNDEYKHMGLSMFLINTQKKFEVQKQYKAETGGFNSGTPTIDKYRKMVDEWKKFGSNHEFSRENILKILNA